MFCKINTCSKVSLKYLLTRGQSSTGIIRFFTKQIATEGFSTVVGQSRCVCFMAY